MKALFICNPSQIQIIGVHLKKNKLFGIKGDVDFDQDYINKYFLSSKESFNKLKDKKVFIGKGDTPHHLFYIDPYLEWSSEQFFGYQIVLDLLQNWAGTEAPGISFLSMVTQKMFNKRVKGKMQSLVREFQHVDILSLENKNSLSTNTYSNNRWKYLKTYALTSAGILDDISHDLSSIVSNRGTLEIVLKRIQSIEELVGQEIVNFILTYSKETLVSVFSNALELKIRNRLSELKPHTPSSIEIPANLNILIIEDNEEHLMILTNALTKRENYFKENESLFSYRSGEEALKELKSSRNEYQLVLLDLKLNDKDGFAQKVHGVDILEELQQNHPLTSFTIITGMGRKAIGELLEIDVKFILSKKQLYSFDTDGEVDTMLLRMFEDVKQRERIKFDQWGPKTGLYRASQFKTKLAALGREEFKRQINDAYEILEKFKAKNSTIKLKLKTQREFEKVKVEELKDLHTSLLAFRLIYLWLAMRKKNKLFCCGEETSEYYDEYSQVMNDWGITVPEKKPNNIGFTARKVGESNGVIVKEIDLQNIWPHEEAVTEEWEEKLELDVYDKNKKEIFTNYPPLYDFLRLHYSYDKSTLKTIGVTVEMKDWNFNDLELFFNVIFRDYSQKGGDSKYFKEIESMSSDDLVYDFFERIIVYYLPKTFEKFMNL